MASAHCLLISPRTVTGRVHAKSNAVSPSYSSKVSTASTIRFTLWKARLEISSLACSAGDVGNFEFSGFGHALEKRGREVCRSLESVRDRRWSAVGAASVDTGESTEAGTSSSSELVDSLLSLVRGSDRGALFGEEEHSNVAGIVGQLEKLGIPEPLKSPLIFGDWDVAYSSRASSPGGGYRTWLGRLIFRTREMIQTISQPDVVVNIVRFALLGLIGGEVILEGKLTPLDDKMIQVDFQSPRLQLGPFKFSYGGSSSVKISINYIDETVRLGRGSRGTIFVFLRR